MFDVNGIEIHSPGYIDFRFLIGIWFGMLMTSIFYITHGFRQNPAMMLSYIPVHGYQYESWHTAIGALLLNIIPMMTSKLAFAHVITFSVVTVILSAFESELFSPPFYDYAGISVTNKVLQYIELIELWGMICWTLPIVFLSFYLSSNDIVRKSSSIVVSIFTSMLDMVTDILVVYTWIISGNFDWAMFQLGFILLGQFYSAVKLYKLKTANIGAVEIILILFGCGKSWYGAKTFKHFDEIEYFKKLKIWEIIFESFPSIVLAVYISIEQNKMYASSVMLSVIMSCVNISMTVMLIMFKDRTNATITNGDMNSNFNMSIQIPSWNCGKRPSVLEKQAKETQLSLYMEQNSQSRSQYSTPRSTATNNNMIIIVDDEQKTQESGDTIINENDDDNINHNDINDDRFASRPCKLKCCFSVIIQADRNNDYDMWQINEQTGQIRFQFET